MTTLTITTRNDVPDSTYFRTGDVEPVIEDRTIAVFDGQGSRRSWGAPQANSRVVYQDDNFVSIHVGFSHKHGGGQFWRHYSVNGEIKRVSWGKLDDTLRAEILASYDKKAPHWAKAPGKTRKDYAKPGQAKMITFKAVNAETMTSLYDSSTIYELGGRLAQAVAPNAGENQFGDVIHNGGWYSHTTVKGVKQLIDSQNLVPARCLEGVEKLAIIKCEISGRVVKFPNGKIASTYLTPVEVVEEIQL